MQFDRKQPNPKTIKISDLVKKLKALGNLEKSFMEESIKKSISLLKKQSNVLSLTSPFVVVGDIHGQFFDLLNILERYPIESNKFLFLGDYVDRGLFCIEVITLLMVLKIQYPNSIYLLRGNHESKNMTSEYNFKQQCCKKYSTETYEKILDWFKMLPLAAVIDGKYFCVHGGLSPDFVSLNQLQRVRRNIEIPDSGIMCDLLWSDPIDDDDKQWQKNSIRGVSYFFSRTLASKFLKQNNFKMIIRAHQLQEEGFKFQQNTKNKNKSEQYSLTLFSAPNYCDKFKNKGAIAIIKKDNISIDTFSQVVHPMVLPGYMDVFEWTLPYITVCMENLVKHMTQQKNKKPVNIQPLKQIANQMQNYENLEFIRELFDKIIVQKNQKFPLKNSNLQSTEQIPLTSSKQSVNKQNLSVPGPFNSKLERLPRKVLRPTLVSIKSLQSNGSSDTLKAKIFNS